MFLLIALVLFIAAVHVWRQPAPTDAARLTRCGLTGALLLAALLVGQLAG